MSRYHWLQCPVCGEHTVKAQQADGGWQLVCANTTCASNGGKNDNGLREETDGPDTDVDLLRRVRPFIVHATDDWSSWMGERENKERRAEAIDLLGRINVYLAVAETRGQ